MRENRSNKQQDELEQNDQLVERLHTAWDQVEQWNNGSEPPSTHYLQMMLEQKRKQLNHKLWLELAILWAIAVVIIAAGYWIAEQSMTALLVLQLVLFVIGSSAVLWTLVIIPRWRKGHGHE